MREAFRTTAPPLPVQRQPYRHHGPLAEHEMAPVRLYVLEADREREQAWLRRRRLAAGLVADLAAVAG
ncbi:hypothetical protein [Streptomyces sp. bgisy153]|uniref:hypothetical protein n=1 Tax=Streptomyces sp. bgisy153 TaxID=3413793 RepID=UPI003D737558